MVHATLGSQPLPGNRVEQGHDSHDRTRRAGAPCPAGQRDLSGIEQQHDAPTHRRWVRFVSSVAGPDKGLAYVIHTSYSLAMTPMEWHPEAVVHMWKIHGVSVTEAEEVYTDVERVVLSPDPDSKSGLSDRVIGYSTTRGEVMVLIVVRRTTFSTVRTHRPRTPTTAVCTAKGAQDERVRTTAT